MTWLASPFPRQYFVNSRFYALIRVRWFWFPAHGQSPSQTTLFVDEAFICVWRAWFLLAWIFRLSQMRRCVRFDWCLGYYIYLKREFAMVILWVFHQEPTFSLLFFHSYILSQYIITFWYWNNCYLFSRFVSCHCKRCLIPKKHNNVTGDAMKRIILLGLSQNPNNNITTLIS